MDTKGDLINKDINEILQFNNYKNELFYIVTNQIQKAKNLSDIKDKPIYSYKSKNKDLEIYPRFNLLKLPKDKFPNF